MFECGTVTPPKPAWNINCTVYIFACLYNTSSYFYLSRIANIWVFSCGYCCMLKQAHGQSGAGSSVPGTRTALPEVLQLSGLSLIICLQGKKTFFFPSSFIERNIWRDLSVFWPFINARGTSASNRSNSVPLVCTVNLNYCPCWVVNTQTIHNPRQKYNPYKEVINSRMKHSTCHEKMTFSTFSLWSALSFQSWVQLWWSVCFCWGSNNRLLVMYRNKKNCLEYGGNSFFLANGKYHWFNREQMV